MTAPLTKPLKKHHSLTVMYVILIYHIFFLLQEWLNRSVISNICPSKSYWFALKYDVHEDWGGFAFAKPTMSRLGRGRSGMNVNTIKIPRTVWISDAIELCSSHVNIVYNFYVRCALILSQSHENSANTGLHKRLIVSIYLFAYVETWHQRLSRTTIKRK
jgi:hypothetical protein